MSLFGFGDITFNKQSGAKFGPLSALEGTQYEKNTFRYPADVGNYDKGHYMVIYIREQRETSFKGQPATDAIPGIPKTAASGLNNVSNISSNFGGGLLSQVNGGLNKINSSTGGKIAGITNAASQGLSKALGGLNGAVGGLGNLFGQNTLFSGDSQSTQSVIDNSIKNITSKNLINRTTTLTTDAIALYMPDTLLYNYSQSYSDLELGNELGGRALAAGSSAIDAYKSGQGSMASLAKALESGGKSGATEVISAGADALGAEIGAGTAKLGFQKLTGAVRNPMLELIYQSPSFRTFQFDFSFYPRDENEALEVQKIIERLRFHQSPEFLKDAGGFLVPPSEFDIKFYYGGSQNPNIPPIATCVLTTIDVNYAPNGFTAYEVPGEVAPTLGRTGMPVAINITLQFKETTYLTKDDFKNFRGAGVKQSDKKV
jgi:hypothetical protein